MSGWLVGKVIIIILSFWVCTSKNKNIDLQVKETCAIMSAKVTCETPHLFTHDSDLTMSSALKFCFLCISL